MKTFIKKFIPTSAVRFYHKVLVWLAGCWYRHPSEKLVVIGVTGTNGKSTTTDLIARVLEATGAKVGQTSTIYLQVGDRKWLNPTKMTMIGRAGTQKLLREMVDAGCQYAVIETSSEGIVQHRNLGINYDVAVFTNLEPEHVESHGGFENYKQAKGKLFAQLSQYPEKIIHGQRIPKMIVASMDSEHSSYFLGFKATRKIGYSRAGQQIPGVDKAWLAENIMTDLKTCSFAVSGTEFKIQLPGIWNVSNALAAISVGHEFGVSMEKMREVLGAVDIIPGRMEFIDEGQDFTVIIDYAPQPHSFKQMLEFLKDVPRKRLIHVFGSAGGGRDTARRPVLGRLAAEYADMVVVTTEDQYDDDPDEIIEQIAVGAREKGKRDGVDLFCVTARRDGIRKGIELAQPGDLVLISGKGSERAMVYANHKKVPWDDRDVAREEIRARLER